MNAPMPRVAASSTGATRSLRATLSIPSATPYPWPFDGAVDPRSVALIVAGHDASWAGRCAPDPRAEEAMIGLAHAVTRSGGAAFALRHVAPVRGRGRASRTPVALADVEPITTAGIDGFFGSALDAQLRSGNRTHLVVCGYGLEAPVHSTLRSANDRGYECLLVADASPALDPSLRAAAVSTVNMSGGIFGAVAEASAVIDAVRSSPPTESPSTTTHRGANP